MLASEFTVLTRLLARIAAGHYSTRDYTIDRLRAALQLFVLEFPVYRTYVTASGPSTEDRATINRAIGAARARWYGSDIDIFDFLRDTLTLDLVAPSRVGYSSARVRNFALKVQQFTGPMMAKSLEDTAFYRYSRLLALNEVGGDPPAPGLSIAEFHRRMEARTVEFSARAHGDRHARYQARRGCARPGAGDLGAYRRLVAGGEGLARDQRSSRRACRWRSRALARARVHAVPDAGRRLAAATSPMPALSSACRNTPSRRPGKERSKRAGSIRTKLTRVR